MAQSIDKLIINSPYAVPLKHWHYDRENSSFNLDDGRLESSLIRFLIASLPNANPEKMRHHEI